jgi:uncharacterized membrane protein
MPDAPPTAPGPPEEPVFRVSVALAYGLRATLAHWQPLVIISFVIFAVQGLLQWWLRRPTDDPLSLLTTFAVYLLGLVASLGLMRAALRITDGRRPSVQQLIDLECLAPFVVTMVVVAAATLLGLGACFVGFLVAGAALGFAPWLVADRRERHVGAALRGGFELSNPAFGPLLGLYLLLLVVNVVGFVLMIVGLVVTYPITAVTLAYTYRTLSGRPVAPLR